MTDPGRPVNGSANGSAPGGTQGRASVGGLATPHPLGGFLPALYQEDEFTQRWTSGLDDVLAPIFSSIDNLGAYLDPLLAPPDFLDWLGNWMGLVVDETWPIERRREFVSHASALYRVRGTPEGLSEHVRIFTGGEVQIVEHGDIATSTTAGAPLPGSPGFDFTVRVTVGDPTKIDTKRLDALVAAAKPAHLAHKVEVVARRQPPARQGRAVPTAAPTTTDAEAETSAEEPSAPQDSSDLPSDGADAAPQEGPSE